MGSVNRAWLGTNTVLTTNLGRRERRSGESEICGQHSVAFPSRVISQVRNSCHAVQTTDGTRLVGWYVPAQAVYTGSHRHSGLLRKTIVWQEREFTRRRYILWPTYPPSRCKRPLHTTPRKLSTYTMLARLFPLFLSTLTVCTLFASHANAVVQQRDSQSLHPLSVCSRELATAPRSRQRHRLAHL